MDKIKLSDLTYRNLFSHQVMMISLFLEYVPKVLASILDLSTLDRLPDTYVSDDLRERRNDIVWRVNLINGSTMYFAVLLEFQSRPDRLMALRIRSYSSLLLLDIANRKRRFKPHSLPYVFPIVMYNGKRPWKVPLDADPFLFVPMPDELSQYCPQQSYILLDERHMPDEELDKRNGLVTQLFKLERSTTMEQFQPVLRRLEELLSESENASLNKMLTLWAATALKRAGFVEESRKFRNLQEVNMLFGRDALENAANWKNVYIQEGEKRGEERGEKRGEKRGEERGEKRGIGSALRALIEDRFGTIPENINSFIASSDSDSLMSLLLFVNKAKSMQAITDRINGKLALS